MAECDPEPICCWFLLLLLSVQGLTRVQYGIASWGHLQFAVHLGDLLDMHNGVYGASLLQTHDPIPPLSLAERITVHHDALGPWIIQIPV